MKHFVLIAALITLNGCDLFTLGGCGTFGSTGYFHKSLVINQAFQNVSMTVGEIRTITLDPHMYIDAVYVGDDVCKTPDYKFVPDYTAIVENGTLADMSVTTGTTKNGRFNWYPKLLNIHAKAGGSTKQTLTARWFIGSDDEAGTSLYGTEEFEIELQVTP